MTDLDRTMIDRVFTNLDYGYVNLPKRVIARSTQTQIGFPVYVLPGETKDLKLSSAKFDFAYERIEQEAPYGAKCEVIKPTAEPVFIENLDPQSPDQFNGQSNSFADGKNGVAGSPQGHLSDDRVLSFDGNNKEKIFIAILAVIVITYVTFKFLI